MNLSEGLQKELERNREVVRRCKGLPQGWIWDAVIGKKIRNAEKAIAQDDKEEMSRCYKELQKTV